MSRPVLTDQQPSFEGGLNAISTASALGESQVSQALNARLTQFGSITKRLGTQRLSTNTIHANGVKGAAEWSKSSGTRFVMVIANGVLYTATYGSLPMTFTAESGSMSSSVYPDLVAFRDGSGDAMYMADGGLLNKVTESGGTFTVTTDIASTGACTSIDVFNQRLWGCGDSTSPQSIFYSAINNGDTLGVGASSGGQIIVRTFGQQNVVAVQALGSSLLIFHRSGISRLTGFGQDDIVAVPAGITGDVGTLSPASIVRVNNVLYYVNVRGLFVATAEGILQVSTPEKPDPLSTVLSDLTEAQLANVTCAFVPATREILVAVPTVGTYVFHTVLMSWSGPWDGAYQSSDRLVLCNVGTSDNVPIVLKGDSSGFLERTDTGTVDSLAAAGTGGTAFTMTVTCRRQFSGDFAMSKSYRWAYLIAELGGSDDASFAWQTGEAGGTISLSQSAGNVLTTEAGDDLTTEGDDILATSVTQQRLRIPLSGTGYYIDTTLQDSSTDATPSFSRVDTQAFALGRR